MRRAALLIAMLVGAGHSSLSARETVDASMPSALAVTLYRDPDRGADGQMNRADPRGFAMITEKRQVTLPPGESTIRFEGVAEGMVAVTALVSGLPGGTIEKNRNAELLSPAALVNGSLGNRVTVTRTNPATGQEASQSAIVRTRADGGLVLQTSDGFEAVRCAGIPERLSFDRVPAGLSAQPVFSIDTRDASGGTYEIELTYLAWGFDWQAHYVATLAEPAKDGAVSLRLMSWLTLLNDNGQSFPDAELLVVAGALNVTSDFEQLGSSPMGRGLSLQCYPLGSTATGSPEWMGAGGSQVYDGIPAPGAPLPAPIMMARAAQFESVVVTAQMAQQEELGDLKLYRVPERVTVAAQSLKQVAFLNQDKVGGRLIHVASCLPWNDPVGPMPAEIKLSTINDKKHGLGMALPMGGVTVFGASSYGDQLIAEDSLRDYAEGQDVEISLGESNQVVSRCANSNEAGEASGKGGWRKARVVLTNANDAAATVRLALGRPTDTQVRGLRGTRMKDGITIVEVTVPANGTRTLKWDVRAVD